MNKISQTNFNDSDYTDLLQLAVREIQSTRKFIAKQINTANNSVYWNLGKILSEKQITEGYGSGVVKQLSIDLKNEFPDMGLSPRNLWNMKRFYERYYQGNTKLLQSVAVLPWGHNLLLLDKAQVHEEVEFYANEVLTKGWSRDLLLNAIKMNIYGNKEKQLRSNNFEQTLPEIHGDYANEVFKSFIYRLNYLIPFN